MTEYSLLRKIADDLRSAADTIENGLTRYQGKLIPVLPDDVNVGDVIRPDNEMWMRVTVVVER